MTLPNIQRQLAMLKHLAGDTANPRYTEEQRNLPPTQRTESPTLPVSSDDVRRAFALAHPGKPRPDDAELEKVYDWLSKAQGRCSVMYAYVLRDRQITQTFTVHDLAPAPLWTRLLTLRNGDTLIVHTRPPAGKYANLDEQYRTLCRHLLAFTIHIPELQEQARQRQRDLEHGLLKELSDAYFGVIKVLPCAVKYIYISA